MGEEVVAGEDEEKRDKTRTRQNSTLRSTSRRKRNSSDLLGITMYTDMIDIDQVRTSRMGVA